MDQVTLAKNQIRADRWRTLIQTCQQSGQTVVSWCEENLRRKFVEVIPPKKDVDAPLTTAEIGRDYCDQLFHIEKGLKDLSSVERKLKRLELEKPVLDAF